MLQMTEAVASLALSEEANQATEALREEMNSACYIHDADFRDLEELHRTGATKELAQLVDLLLCDPHYSVRYQSGLQGPSQDVFRPDDMDDLCNLAKA